MIQNLQLFCSANMSLINRCEETCEAAQVQLQQAVRRTQVKADRRGREGPNLVPGQWVWLSTETSPATAQSQVRVPMIRTTILNTTRH